MSADAINEWIIIYRGYTGEQLACEKTKLQKWLNNPFDAQAQGGKSYERSRASIVSQLAALQRVLNEKSGTPCIGIMDASGGVWGVAIPTGESGYPDSWA